MNSSSSGEGKENLKASYNSEDLTVGFNSRYLLDIASEIKDQKLTMNLNDSVSPVLIQDNSDTNTYFVIMPMKIWYLNFQQKKIICPKLSLSINGNLISALSMILSNNRKMIYLFSI